MYEPKEPDWKKYKNLVDGAEEDFYEKSLAVIVAQLQDKSQKASDRFWKAREKFEKGVSDINDCIDRHSRSSMFPNLMQMHRNSMIDDDDLKSFSSDLQKSLKRALETFK